MLELKDICKTYKPKNGPEVKALKSVSVKFAEKGLVFILGKSGCGKSTMLNCIGGLDRFDSGEIIIKGKSSKEFSGSDFDSYRNTFLGFIFQEYNILSEFNIEKNIALALELQGKKATRAEVKRILDIVDLGDMGKRKTTELSGGQKQRVAIARALIKDPEIIIADEPTGALDSATGIQVFETLKKLAKDKLVIVVSHDREFAELYGDRIIEMKDGVIISDETKRKVQPNMVSDDLTLIGEDLIHIRAGHKFDQSEKDIIIKFLESRDNETIISFGEKSNKKFKQIAKIDDENRTEMFTPTTDRDKGTKQYDKKQLKLIKSRLKWKDSFKMGASSLKTKPIRLFFTILLSFVAFGIFGVVDAVGSFNRPEAVYSTIKEFKQDNVAITKELAIDYYSSYLYWKNDDLKYIQEEYPDIDVLKVVNSDVPNRSSYSFNYYNKMIVPVNENIDPNLTSHLARVPFFSGMVHIEDSDLERYGLELVAGGMPTASGEIAISKHLFNCLMWLDEENIKNEEDLLSPEHNQVVVGENNVFKIVGVIDDGSDMSKYTNMTTEELNKAENYSMLDEIKQKLSFGFVNMIYIDKSYYEQSLSKTYRNDYNLTRYGDEGKKSIGRISGNFYTIEDIQYDVNLFANKFKTYQGLELVPISCANGRPVDLNDGTIILSKSMVQYLIEEYLNPGAVVKGINLDLKDSAGNTIKQLRVVGYYDSSELNGSMFVSKSDAKMIAKVSGGVKLMYETERLDTVSTAYKSLEDGFFDPTKSWSSDVNTALANLGIQYLKTGVDLVNGGVISGLNKNDIIIDEGCLSKLGSGQELYDMIDNGLKIEFRMSISDELDPVFVFNVVGVSSQKNYVSKKTFDEVILPEISGVDYIIAKLTGNEEVDKAFIVYCETPNDNFQKFTVQNSATTFLDSFGNTIAEITGIIFWIGVGFAVFASLLLMNFISTSISYKKREIGILRALGARSGDVFGIFLNESMVIAVINFVLASISTLVVVKIITNSIISGLGIDIVLITAGVRQIVLILAVSVLSAILSSLIPVSGIARKQPVDAINNR